MSSIDHRESAAATTGRRVSRAAPWGLCFALAACNAHIAHFEVAPRHACAGQAVDIRWQVQGKARLSVLPTTAGAPEGDLPSRGQVTIHPTGKTRVSLRVTRWLGEPTGADVDVDADVDMAAPVEIAATLADGSCQDGVLTMKTETKGFGDDLRAVWVNANQRALDITRLDGDGHVVTARVVPGEAATRAFAMLSVNGRWTLSTKLAPGESCQNPPPVLTATVSPGCQGGTP